MANLMNGRLVLHSARVKNGFKNEVTQAQKILDAQVLKDLQPYTPFRSSKLEQSSISGTTVGSGKITYTAKYARKQYYMYPNKSKAAHPKATMKWFEAAKAVNKERWRKVAAKAVSNG